VQLFDLWDRVYGYPLEITLEAMAPTTEHDFLMLPPEKREIYQAVQRMHMHGSPDGPWFFILARSLPDENRYELLGITDTSMLRPQVFALYENDAQGGETSGQERVQIGLIASERQAINACLRSLANEDERFQPLADKYWVARGGSHTDGGAFRFTFSPGAGLACANKFGEPVRVVSGRQHVRRSLVDPQLTADEVKKKWEQYLLHAYDNGGVPALWPWMQERLPALSWHEFAWVLGWMEDFSRQGVDEWRFVLENLSWLRDRRYHTGRKKRASVLRLLDETLSQIFNETPLLGGEARTDWRNVRRLSWDSRPLLSPPPAEVQPTILVLDTSGFPPEGEESAARYLARAYEQGWQQLIAYNWRGGRFAACGLGAGSHDARIDLYGDVGDYAASGLDGAEVHLHGDGQDQLGQIMKLGKLVVYGDVGQTFLYGAKGGEVFVLGSAAGRPLINAVGNPRVVINGTCLDYLAESFMAGDPLHGGGFVILNGVAFDERGVLQELPTPYPGGNLFSLASGGAVYLRDPHSKVTGDQLNGGVFAPLSSEDWALIEPYLIENERLFGIPMIELLTVKGQVCDPAAVYRKVIVEDIGVLREGENR